RGENDRRLGPSELQHEKPVSLHLGSSSINGKNRAHETPALNWTKAPIRVIKRHPQPQMKRAHYLAMDAQSATDATICHGSRSRAEPMSPNFDRVLVKADQQKSLCVRTEIVAVPGNEPSCHQLF